MNVPLHFPFKVGLNMSKNSVRSKFIVNKLHWSHDTPTHITNCHLWSSGERQWRTKHDECTKSTAGTSRNEASEEIKSVPLFIVKLQLCESISVSLTIVCYKIKLVETFKINLETLLGLAICLTNISKLS